MGAMSATANADALTRTDDAKHYSASISNHNNILNLTEAFAKVMAVQLLCEEDRVGSLERAVEHLGTKKTKECLAADDPALWCIDTLMASVYKGQQLGLYSSEVAAEMYQTICSLQRSYRGMWL